MKDIAKRGVLTFVSMLPYNRNKIKQLGDETMIENKLNLKSIKMQKLDNEGALLKWRDDSRWIRAYKHVETGNYILEAGYHGQPADFDLEMTDIQELEDEMRETANLRHWFYGVWE